MEVCLKECIDMLMLCAYCLCISILKDPPHIYTHTHIYTYDLLCVCFWQMCGSSLNKRIIMSGLTVTLCIIQHSLYVGVVKEVSPPYHSQGSSTERLSRNTLRVVTAKVYYLLGGSLTSRFIFFKFNGVGSAI